MNSNTINTTTNTTNLNTVMGHGGVQYELRSSPPSIPPGGRGERVQYKLKPERVQFTYDRLSFGSDSVVAIVDGVVLYKEHFEIGVVTSGVDFEAPEMACGQVAAAFKYAGKLRLGKAVGSLRAAAYNLLDFFEDLEQASQPALNIELTKAGYERLGAERIEKLKPERVQTKLLSSPPSIPPGGRGERVQYTLNGEPVSNDVVILIVDGYELEPASIAFGATAVQLKPERVQFGLERAVEAVKFTVHRRYRKAVKAFGEAFDTLQEIVADLLDIDLWIEVFLEEPEIDLAAMPADGGDIFGPMAEIEADFFDDLYDEDDD
jgi:hypothetical protein